MKTQQTANCVKCDAELLPPDSRGGRPSRFCSEGCKVSVEAEMRRLNVVLRRLEDARAKEPLRWGNSGDADRVQAAVARYDEAITPLQKRFDRLAGVPSARHARRCSNVRSMCVTVRSIAVFVAGGLCPSPEFWTVWEPCSRPAHYSAVGQDRRRQPGISEEIGRDDREHRVSCDFPAPLVCAARKILPICVAAQSLWKVTDA